MRIQTEEWRSFIPGSRMYKGKFTLFYNGEHLWDPDTRVWNGTYDWEETDLWQVIIVLPGVEVIHATFAACQKVETVIMSDTVRRIEGCTFGNCKRLSYVRLSRNLEYIPWQAFSDCVSLTSIFIPPSCRVIADSVFTRCEKLIILRVSRHTELRDDVIVNTSLMKASPFTPGKYGLYKNTDEVNEWIKTHHEDNEFSVHRACSDSNPQDEVIFEIIKREGLQTFNKPDRMGVTASQYLSENPYTEIKEQDMIKRYILDMMGEVI